MELQSEISRLILFYPALCIPDAPHGFSGKDDRAALEYVENFLQQQEEDDTL